MSQYRYIARDFAGLQIQGLLNGSSEMEVLEWLREHEYTPISIELVVQKVKRTWITRHKPIRAEHLSSLCWQLHTMLEGGVPITEALDTIAEDAEHVRMQKILKRVSESMKAGESFYESLSKYPHIFSGLFCSMIRSGEVGGTLTSVLKRASTFYEQRDELQRKVKKALVYPAFVISFIIIVIVAMMVFVVPRFEAIFSSFGNKLPAFTRSFMAFYHFMAGHLITMLGGTIAAILVLILLGKTEKGQRIYSWLCLRVPLFGDLYHYSFLAMYGQTVSTLLTSGVSILEAHDIVESMSRNDYIRQAIRHTREQISEGVGVALSMMNTKLFPRMLTRMVQVGEDSGSLPGVLDRTSVYYEKKVDITVSTLITILEPALIIIIGGIVLTILLALYLPVFSMSGFQGG